MKVAVLFRHPWLLSLVLGLVLTLVSLLYLAFPYGYGDDDISRRPQLRFSGPAIQLANTPLDEGAICTASLVEKHWGFPASVVSVEGSNGCAAGRQLSVLGLVFNIAVYAALFRAIIFAWRKARQ